MSYALYDVNGYIGDFATTAGFDEVRSAMRDSSHLARFMDMGAALVTPVLVGEVRVFKSDNEQVQSVMDNLIELLEKAELVVIINNGLE